MSIRIIAGELRGRRLGVADLPGLRPTTDRMRETIFNILTSRLEISGLGVLDLFAGSGALGIEALSRGAESAVFVEKSGPAIRQLTKNLEDLDLLERATILRGDVFARMRQLERFDLVLADPPYRTDLTGRLLAMVPENLTSGGYFFLERPHPSVDHPSSRLREVVDRSVGSTRLTLYRGEQEHDQEK